MEFKFESPSHSMETLKTPRLPELPQNIHLDVSNSQAQVNVGKYVIDTPRDEDFKKRQQLWSYHQKNRGANNKTKTVTANVQDKSQNEIEGVLDGQDSYLKQNCVEREAERILKYKRGLMPSRHKSRTDISVAPKKDQKEGVLTYTYSSALTIGNSIYSQLRGKDKERFEASQHQSIDKDKKKSIVNSIDKLPDLTAALTKLGYLKLTRNVVHHGGGFFGRQGDKKYMDLRRSFSTTEVDTKLDNTNCDNIDDPSESLLQSIDCLDSVPLKLHQAPNFLSNTDGKGKKTSSVDVSARKSVEKKNAVMKETATYVKRIDEYRKQFEPSERLNNDYVNRDIPKVGKPEESRFDRWYEKLTRSILEEEKMKDKPTKNKFEEEKIKCVSRKQNKVIDNVKEIKTTVGSDSKIKDEFTNIGNRPSSNISLDIPEDKYGPSSQPRDHKSPKYPWVCGTNPYRWTNKPALTANDKPWVERALQKADVIDQTTYDGFARTRPPKVVLVSEQTNNAIKEKQSNHNARTGS